MKAMKRKILCLIAMLGILSSVQAKDLVAYFSATGNTKAVAEEIARQMGADILRIEAAEPYAANPYDDSDRVQNEAYKDLRPGVANLPSAETMSQYDRIFIGSPIWWHQPAMVVCTFLEAFDLSGKTVIPFFTYGATTYLNESMHKIYKVTPASNHIPETLPEDLNPDDITTPGPADDSGIDMPGNARGVESWLRRLGLIGASVGSVNGDGKMPFDLQFAGSVLQINMADDAAENAVDIFYPNGSLLLHEAGSLSYTVQLPRHSAYLVSVIDRKANRLYSRKIIF